MVTNDWVEQRLDTNAQKEIVLVLKCLTTVGLIRCREREYNYYGAPGISQFCC